MVDDESDRSFNGSFSPAGTVLDGAMNGTIP
jgi:hypothetical protein